MTLESSYYIAGIASFFVGLGGLIGLIVYAVDTHKLRDAAQKQVTAAQHQLEAAITPCVLVFDTSGAVDAPLLFKNSGTGVALNVRWRYSASKSKEWTEFSALGPGEGRKAPFLTRDIINYGAIECVFESISGTPYLTLSGFSDTTTNLDYRHQFKRLSRDS